MGVELDPWQKEILETKGNIVLCSGRQVGKSTIISIRDGERAANKRNESILIISATERQATEIFLKTLNYLEEKYPRLIKKGKSRPTRHVIKLTNGSIIRCLPTGLAGTGIRGFTITKLTADEAAFCNEAVWSAVTPMLLTTGGDMDLLSTPHGKMGFFYECYKNEGNNFKVFHINSEEVIRNRPVSRTWTEYQRLKALQFLEIEKRRMSSLEYAQEYLGEFVDDLQQFFNDDLIDKICTIKRREKLIKQRSYFLGSDIARLGGDESTFQILDGTDAEKIEQVESIVKKHLLITKNAEEIIGLEKIYKFSKIGIDDRAVGAGVFDILLKEDEVKRKIVGLDNSKRALSNDKKKNIRLLKEDMYLNLLSLMEKGKIKLLNDDEIRLSLKSVQYEYITTNQKTRFRVFGSYTHIVEGIIRAAFLIRDKPLNIWIRSC